MSKSSLLSFFSVSTLCFGLSLPISATTITIGAAAPVGSLNTSFDSGLPSNWTASGPNAGTASASAANQYTQPSGDTTPFAYVGVGSSLTATFASGISSLGLLWGSPDTWNVITFKGSGGTETFSPGSGLLSGLNPINSGAQNVLFVATPGGSWTSVTFTSSLPAFEFDNVAVVPVPSALTPEPTSITLLAGGLLAIGVGSLRRRKS